MGFFYFKDKNTDVTVKDNTDDFCLRDTLSIASTDSFVSTAEVRLKDGFFKESLTYLNNEQKNLNFLVIIVSKVYFSYGGGKKKLSLLSCNQLPSSSSNEVGINLLIIFFFFFCSLAECFPNSF